MTETPFTINTPTGSIAGADSGQGSALLFLHGGPGLSDYTDLLAPELDGWRTVHYQQRGLPPSSVDGPFTVEQHLADAIAVLDTRNVSRAVVVGHSWGAHLALELAVARPERVAGLVLIDGPGATGDGGIAEMGQALIDRLAPAGRDRLQEIADRMAANGPADDAVTEQTALLWPGYFAEPATAPPWPPSMRVSAAAYVGTMGSMLEHLATGFAESLSGITAPVIFVLGELSPMPLSRGKRPPP